MKKNAIKEQKKRSLRLKSADPNTPFMLACAVAKVKPTLRQWTKWTKERGAAFKEKHNV